MLIAVFRSSARQASWRRALKHKISVHEGMKPFECNICDTRFYQKNNLADHISMVHEENRPNKCEICDFATFHKNDLNRHILTVHEGKMPYNCKICNSGFSHPYRLKDQNSYVDEGKKPYKCDIELMINKTSWIITLWWLSVSLWRICITFVWPSRIFCIDKTVPGTKPPGGYNQDSCR